MPEPRRKKSESTATATRSPRAEQLRSALLSFDLKTEMEQLRREESWQWETGRSSKTLVKHADLRIVLVQMKAGTRMHEHKATARISIQTLSGHISVHLPDRIVELPTGHLLALDQCLAHDVEARDDSAFLLTMSWPAEEEILACTEHQGRKNRHAKN